MLTLADTDFVTVALHEDLHLVSVTWKPKALSFSDYKYAFEVSLEYQEKGDVPIFNFLSDVRAQTVVSPQYRKWFQEVAVPSAAKFGMKRGAVATDASVFKRYYLNHIMDTTKHFGLALKLFKEPENAFKWFKSCLAEDLAKFQKK